jgi:hypothetical protein
VRLSQRTPYRAQLAEATPRLKREREVGQLGSGHAPFREEFVRLVWRGGDHVDGSQAVRVLGRMRKWLIHQLDLPKRTCTPNQPIRRVGARQLLRLPTASQQHGRDIGQLGCVLQKQGVVPG